MTIGEDSTTDIGGNFEGSGTAVMEGRYLKVNDNCGSASLEVSENGIIDWGTSDGTDCKSDNIQNFQRVRIWYLSLTANCSFLPQVTRLVPVDLVIHMLLALLITKLTSSQTKLVIVFLAIHGCSRG